MAETVDPRTVSVQSGSTDSRTTGRRARGWRDPAAAEAVIHEAGRILSVHGRRPGYFERATAGDAARQFRYATGLFVGSLVLWAIVLGAGGGWLGELSGWGRLAAVGAVAVEVLLGVLFVGATLEYAAWIRERLGGG